MSKRSLFILLSIISMGAAHACETANSHGPKPLALQFHKSKFTLLRECAAPVTIHPAFMDKELRGISKDRLEKLIAMGAQLHVNKMKDCDDYALRLKGGLHGGGILGATAGAFLFKAAVSVVGHGSIALVAGTVGIFCPPAGVAVGIALESTCGVAIEAASMAAAVGGGIVGGVATGPV